MAIAYGRNIVYLTKDFYNNYKNKNNFVFEAVKLGPGVLSLHLTAELKRTS